MTMLINPFVYASAGGGSVLPASITNAWAWYPADNQTGHSDGDTLSTITDFSGNSRHATQSNSVLQPLYKTNQVNSQPAFYFDGNYTALKYVDIPDMSALTQGHFFVVLKMDTDGDGALGDTNGCWQMSSNDTVDLYFPYVNNRIYDNWGRTDRVDFDSGATAMNIWRAYEVESASGSWKARLDGSIMLSTTGTVGFSSTPSFGACGETPSRSAKFKVAEILICSSVQGSTARSDWATYINNKYGLSTS